MDYRRNSNGKLVKAYTHKEKQEMILDELEGLLGKIESCRYWNGEDPSNKAEIDARIVLLSDKLDSDHMEDFEIMLEGR